MYYFVDCSSPSAPAYREQLWQLFNFRRASATRSPRDRPACGSGPNHRARGNCQPPRARSNRRPPTRLLPPRKRLSIGSRHVLTALSCKCRRLLGRAAAEGLQATACTARPTRGRVQLQAAAPRRRPLGGAEDASARDSRNLLNSIIRPDTLKCYERGQSSKKTIQGKGQQQSELEC